MYNWIKIRPNETNAHAKQLLYSAHSEEIRRQKKHLNGVYFGLPIQVNMSNISCPKPLPLYSQFRAGFFPAPLWVTHSSSNYMILYFQRIRHWNVNTKWFFHALLLLFNARRQFICDSYFVFIWMWYVSPLKLVEDVSRRLSKDRQFWISFGSSGNENLMVFGVPHGSKTWN